jgi:poly-gamma-glutamate synthesis protein (capsule biosynthesis protein)
VEVVTSPGQADLRFEPGTDGRIAAWTFVVVAPFPTIADALSLADLQQAWRGDGSGTPVFVSPQTREALAVVLGPPGNGVRTFEDREDLVDFAWSARPALGVVPFEDLEIRWKVLALEGQSPLDPGFDPASYPLTVEYSLAGGVPVPADLLEDLEVEWEQAPPLHNRRPDRMTTVVMTGVTALTRATAWQMDRSGVTFPARDIGAWLRSADLTHISHEVAFTPDCPPALPDQTVLRFCASPAHVELLSEIGADVIELTGNHVLDAGPEALLYTLDLYQAQGFRWFGGGRNLDEARQAVRFEHNGNRIAFLGCNEAGPPGAWATEARPGANPCGADRMRATLEELVRQGYLPIATFQWHEHYTPVPPASQREAFRAAAAAGAAAVSGSQAHQPQAFEFHDGAFVHYGPGNLFFDQMWSSAVRQEFIDRYVFHDGRLISVELLTAYLEDWSRPRPMTPEERADFLGDIFRASGW